MLPCVTLLNFTLELMAVLKRERQNFQRLDLDPHCTESAETLLRQVSMQNSPNRKNCPNLWSVAMYTVMHVHRYKVPKYSAKKR